MSTCHGTGERANIIAYAPQVESADGEDGEDEDDGDGGEHDGDGSE